MRDERTLPKRARHVQASLRRKGPMGPTRDPIAAAAGQALEVPTAAVQGLRDGGGSPGTLAATGGARNCASLDAERVRNSLSSFAPLAYLRPRLRQFGECCLPGNRYAIQVLTPSRSEATRGGSAPTRRCASRMASAEPRGMHSTGLRYVPE